MWAMNYMYMYQAENSSSAIVCIMREFFDLKEFPFPFVLVVTFFKFVMMYSCFKRNDYVILVIVIIIYLINKLNYTNT